VAQLFSLGSIRAMQNVRHNKVRRISAYIAGGFFIALGIMGFLVEISEGEKSSTIVAGYVMASVFVIWGTLLCLAVRFHYGGALWSAIGVILVTWAMIYSGFTLDSYLRGRHLTYPVRTFSLISIFWGVGCYCLVWGHMRHHRKMIDHDAA
jgi:hypothetical protein